MFQVISTKVVSGTGKFERTGIVFDKNTQESIDIAYRFFKANCKNVSESISISVKEYLMHVQVIHGGGLSGKLALTAFIGLCSTD